MLRWRLPDNPFLIRELRQHRRQSQPLVYLGVLVGVMAALTLILAAVDRSVLPGVPVAQSDRDGMAGSLVGLHTLGMLGYGLYAGSRLLVREQRRGTLDDVLLMPERPPRQFARLLTFPLLLILTVWIAGLPVYLCASLLGVASCGLFLREAGAPLAVGIWQLLSSLAFPFGVFSLPAETRFNGWKWTLLRVWLASGRAAVAVFLIQMAVLARSFVTGSSWSYTQRWYGLYVPVGWLYVVTGLLLTAAAVLTQLAVLHRNPLTAWRLVLARAAVLNLLIGTMLGLLNGSLEWVRYAVVGLILALGLRNRYWQEDGQSRRDLASLERRCPNAMLIRDLWSVTRKTSLRRGTLFSAATGIVGVLVGLLTAVVFRGWIATAAAGGLLGASIYAALLVPQMHTARIVRVERFRQLDVQLLFTALSSRDLVWGRWGAAQATLLTRLYVWAGFAAAGAAWLMIHYPHLVPAMILPAMCGILAQPRGPIVKLSATRQLAEIGLAFLQVALLMTPLAVYLVYQSTGSPALMAGLSVAVTVLGLVIWWGQLHYRVRQWDAVRSGHLEFADPSKLPQ